MTVQRVDKARKVIVRPQGSEPVAGARVPITMDEKYDRVTLVTAASSGW